MEKHKLRQIMIDHQKMLSKKEDDLIEREVDLKYYLKGNEIVIISGIRRCGKSTLLRLISNEIEGMKLYLDFDDVRLTDFQLDNFQDVEDLAFELVGTSDVSYFFDEIQNIPNWERWVNNLYGKGRKVFLTGSNSRLLSSEISTFLTGRNKVIKLFPFSFSEFLLLRGFIVPQKSELVSWTKNLTSDEIRRIFGYFNEYFEIGGFPLVDRNDDVQLSRQYFEDIVNKDIFSRYGIRHVKEVKDLILYLFSNTGTTFSYSTLKRLTDIKSLSTLKNYIDYLKNVFLLYTIDRFDFSIQKQKISSSKPYIADNSFYRTISFNFSENKGHRLENLVFLELLRRGKEVYYHKEKRECDFIVKEGLDISDAIQVSYDLSNPITRKRELEGVKEAMRKYNLDKGLILTFEDSELIPEQGITILPVWEWLLTY